MTARHQVSSAALELIMRFEGFRRRAARLADGRWTIGYGHTLTAREGAEVSLDDAEALLIYDIRPITAAVNELTYTPLTQNQFDALVAFTYSIGVDNFRRSAVLRRVNEGALIQAACAIEMWRRADFEGERIVVDALVRRRAAEKTLFLTPTDGWIPAPSPILRPRVDYDVAQNAPKSSTELESSMTGDVAEAHRTPPEEAPASLAAADAVRVRLNEILPETAEVPTPENETLSLPLALEPRPEPAAESAPFIIEPVEPTPPVAPTVSPDKTHSIAEAGVVPAYLAAPALFSALFIGTHEHQPAPAAPEIEPIPEMPPAPEAAFEPSASEPSEPAPYVAGEPDYMALPERPQEMAYAVDARDPMDLSRRVVREAPMETETSRLLGGGLKGLSPLVLMILFLAGLAVFAGGIVWGMSSKGSGLISWILGLIGIVCVVSSVYVYLERLGDREE